MKTYLKKIVTRIVRRIVCFSTFYKQTDFSSILILSPHPDDEILGLGGIILQTLQQGSSVILVYLSDGEGSGVWSDQEEIKRQRIALSEQVCGKLGLKSSDITRLHLPDGKVPHPGQRGFEEAVQSVKHLIETLKPDAVFATHTLDYWPFDHVACAYIAKEAMRQSASKPQLWFYWVWTWYNLRPWQLFKLNYKKINRVDISKQLTQKKELSDLYLNAHTSDGNPWSGVLPKTLLRALEQPFEVIERIL